MYTAYTVIATSGIDYNIKLWEPVAAEEASLSDLDEVSRLVTLHSCVYNTCTCMCMKVCSGGNTLYKFELACCDAMVEVLWLLYLELCV